MSSRLTERSHLLCVLHFSLALIKSYIRTELVASVESFALRTSMIATSCSCFRSYVSCDSRT